MTVSLSTVLSIRGQQISVIVNLYQLGPTVLGSGLVIPRLNFFFEFRREQNPGQVVNTLYKLNVYIDTHKKKNKILYISLER